MRCARFAIFLNLFIASALPVVSQRIQLTPRLHAGQRLVYRVDFHSSRSTKTESQVISPQTPADSNLDVSGLLQVAVIEAGASGLRLKTYLSEKPVSASSLDSSLSNQLREGAPDKLVEVELSADGRVSQTKGLEQLSAGQQFAWKTWLAQFATSMTFPKDGIAAGQRWKSTEPESSASPIAKLSWVKKSQYVRNENCEEASNLAPTGQAVRSTTQKCAVILVQAQLRQETSRDKTTPPDFKLRGLATRGSSTGSNQTILYISRETGVLVRSTEDAQQAMDATVSLEDGSNYVRYLIHAKSRSIIQLLPE